MRFECVVKNEGTSSPRCLVGKSSRNCWRPKGSSATLLMGGRVAALKEVRVGVLSTELRSSLYPHKGAAPPLPSFT